MSHEAAIDAFLADAPHAVVGASTDRQKYGNKVLRSYLQNDREVYAVNPRADEVEGLVAYDDLAALPRKPHGISVITPPAVTTEIVRQAIELGIQNVWLQPGAESEEAVELARQHDLNLIWGGPCALVVLGFRET